MRVATEHRLVTANPGDTVEVRVDVVNTGELIEGVTAHLIGLPDGQISVEPQLLPLFPDSQGQITLSIGVPTHQPAGMHPLTIAVVSHGSGSPTQHVDVDLSVSARPAVKLSADPQTIRSKRAGRFVLMVENSGNVALDATLATTQEDKRTKARFSAENLRVEPGVTSPVILAVKGPRMLTGAETDRMVTVGLVARRAHTIPAMDETETGPELVRETVVRLRQKPLVSRGLLTALILMSIVALWAAIFLLGLTQVLSGDPMTKTAPASFFPVSADTGSGDADGDGSGGDAAGAPDAAAAPAGAMPKTGLLPAGVGGEISGTVTSASDQLPAGRITVQAYRQGRDGLVQVSSAASQADGTYSLAGLFPTAYVLRFSADGYRPVWYPNAPSRSGAKKVTVAAQGTTEGVNAVIQGKPASITGDIDPGDSLEPVSTTVVARMTGSTGDAAPVARTVAKGASYTLTNLPAPATYELSFTAPGYQATKVVTTVAGGEPRIQPTVVLDAGTGQISGTVTDGTNPLGNVTITTTVSGKEVSVISPTTGQVGAYTLDHLPTPGTYMLTFRSEGHGAKAVIVDLEAGQSKNAINAKLVAGTGSILGVVRDAAGNGLGGTSVIVGGSVQTGGSVDSSTLPSTTTLTDGAVGSFTIGGLKAPGDYTLTFVREGYASETVPISLSANGAPPEVNVTLGTQLGGIRGTVTGPGGGVYVGASVTATNGSRAWTTTSSGAGGTLANGGYLFSSLQPGTYSVTITADGIRQRTGIVKVTSGATAVQSFQPEGGGLMYVELNQRRIVAVPQRPEPLEITISNTSDVIAGYTLRFLGADPSWIEVEETDLSLFPDETRTITAQITVPVGMVAGDRRITVQVRELTPPESTSIEEVVLVVPEARAVQMRVDPMALTAGKQGRFGLLVDNTGNTTIHSRLTGTDAEGKVRFDFDPPVLDLQPGEHAVVELKARAKRPFVGGPFVRILDIGLEDPLAAGALPPVAPPATVEEKLTVQRQKKNPAAPSPGSEAPALANASFVQKAVLARGLLSLLGLLFALSVFAVVITLALSRIVGQSAADRNLALEIAQARNAAATSGSSGMSGTVLLLTSGAPVPGVAIDVYPADDTSSPIANTATSDKGTWAVSDLPAGDYKVTFRGAGFVQLWYPQALSADNSETVTLEANSQRAGLDVSLGGVPASIKGTVLGDDVSAATLALTVPVAGAAATGSDGTTGAVVQTVPIGSDGSFELTNVPSPSVYDLVVTKTGYATATQRVDVSAGEERGGVEISLRKGDGVISGVVKLAAGPLGGVTISAKSGQTEVTTISLTNQQVGSFTLRGLPTPGSYTVVASKPGFASQTMTLTLAKGQKLTGVGLTLGKSSGSLKGAVTLLPDRTPAAGVAVTVTDGEHTIVTATQSSGDIGAWKVGGLAVPGTYTVTFTRGDLAAQTLSVSLDATGQITPGSQGATVTSAGIEVAMQPSSAVVKGTIRQPATSGSSSTRPVGEVSVQLSSGSATYSVISASVPDGQAGTYRIENVPPGTYTVSVSRNGVSPTSTILQLTAGQVRDYSPVLAAAASISGKVTQDGVTVPAGWYVDLYRSSAYPDEPYRTVRTTANGTFEFEDVDAPEVYVVEVRPTRGSTPQGSRTFQLAASQQLTITVKADP